jgi:hypothetical protein
MTDVITHPAPIFAAGGGSLGDRGWTDPAGLGIHPDAVPIDRIAVGVSFQARSRNSKLAPVRWVDRGRTKPEPVAAGPYIASTYASIVSTCPASCGFRDEGCYAEAGSTGAAIARLNRIGGATHRLRIADQEAALIDRAFNGRVVPQDGGRHGDAGRDLRLRVGGDYTTDEEARVLAYAAERWESRDGGGVFAYTHGWRGVQRESFGGIRVLASVEEPGDIAEAHDRRYDAAIVVDRFPSDRAFTLPGTSVKAIPCPEQTRGTTCVKCRLCIEAPLRDRGAVIAFAVHGPRAERARRRLRVLAA